MPVLPEHNPSFNDSQERGYSLHPDFIQFVLSALETGNSKRVLNLVQDTHAADIAELINIIKPEQRAELIRMIRLVFDPEVLIDLEPDVKDEVIGLLGAEHSAAAITQLDTDDAVQVIEDLEREDQQDILDAIPDKEHRAHLEEGLGYEEDSAGRLTEKNFVSIPANWSVGQTIDYVRNKEDLPKDFYNIFIVDSEGHPVGYATVSRILRSERDIEIKNIMEPDIKTINVDTDQEEVAYIFRKYGLSSCPVVDDNGMMVGVIDVDDVVDVIEEEAEEDIMRLGGVKETDLYSASAQTAFRRFPWLFINLLTAIAASAVIAMFTGEIEKLVALAVLMPIVASMAGNAGTQTMTIAVRAIATRELTATNAMRVVGKEVNASIINGLLFAVIVGIASMVFYGNMELSIIFAAATITALVIAAFAGAAIPLLLARIGVDPAIASGVFLTTVTDIAAFFSFLGLAALWLI